ncbi:MAG: MarR family winged helix-turn-helix transcriptional regulator [Parvularculaceae bacterium]|nr:MarR family transcriptional regulator [Parvularculaceae bacterium]
MANRKISRAKTGPAESGFFLEDYVLYNLVRTAATYNEEMAKALKRYRLDTMKWRILMLLNDKSPSSVGELARRSVTKMPTLTRVLIRMEDEGLIVRQAQEGDKRVVQVTMTPKAVTVLRTVQSIGQKIFERATEGVSEDEAAALTALLKRIRANLGRSPYEPAVEPPQQLKARAS